MRSFPEQLTPLPAFQALERFQEFLEQLKTVPPPEPEESRQLKEQWLAQAATLESGSEISLVTRQAQAAGLLCGALDGLRLYVESKEVLDFVAPSSSWKDALAELTEVADQYWRGLDIESLHQQSVYARQENLKTESENLTALAGADASKLRNQLSETFRIAYGMGLLDSARAYLFIKR